MFKTISRKLRSFSIPRTGRLVNAFPIYSDLLPSYAAVVGSSPVGTASQRGVGCAVASLICVRLLRLSMTGLHPTEVVAKV